ncbi:MAG: hypothetical protein OHK0045_12480 [Raineya sp.]
MKNICVLSFAYFVFFLSFGQHHKTDSLLEAIDKQQIGKDAIYTMLKLGESVLFNAPEEAIRCASLALKKANIIKFRAGQIAAYNLLANAHLQKSQAGDIKRAFQLYSQNLDLLENTKLSEEEELEQARSLSGLANIYYQWGEYKEAILLNIKSLSIREKLKDEFGMARCFNTSGVIYDALGEYKKAVLEYTKALNIYEKLKKKREIAGVLDNLASSLKLQIESSQEQNPDFSQVIDYYNRSLKISEEIADNKGISRTLNNIGILAQSQKDYPKAKKFYEKSVEIALKSQEKNGLASTYNSLARLHQEQNLLDEALLFYEKALQIADETESKYELYVALKERSKVFASKGLFPDAYTDLQASIVLKQQLDEAENLRAINNLMGKYEVEKFQKENEKLKYEATIQSQNNKIFWGFATFFMAMSILTALFFFRQNQIKEKHNHKLLAINLELERKNREIEAQKSTIAANSSLLNDSISFAQHIQQSILPTEQTIQKLFTDFFVYCNPQPALSSNFYWVANKEQQKLLICGNCTEQGISGAMATMMAVALLNEIVLAQQIWKPADILSKMHEKIKKYKSDKYKNFGINLGVLLIADKNTKEVVFAGANITLWVFQKELKKILLSSRAVGDLQIAEQDFQQSIIGVEEETTLYLLSDGTAEQLSNSGQIKTSTHRLEQLLYSLAHLSLQEQEKQIKQALDSGEQANDMLLLAIRLNEKK